MLSDLLRLAQDATRASRRKLLQRVADVFLEGVGKHTKAELELFCDIILKLLDTTEAEERADLSRRIAPHSDTPRPVAVRLAKDEISVAAPMLELSPALTESDLMKLARRLPQPHLEAIAKRSGMSTRLCDTLIERGKARVWRIIAANSTVTMSDWALRTLAKYSLTDTALRDHIALREDLTPLICEWLLPHVNAATGLRLQAIMAGADPLETTDVNRIRQDLRRRLGLYLDNCDAARLWGLLEQGNAKLNDLILVLIDEKRVNDAIQLLAQAADRPVAKVQTAIYQAAIDGLIQLGIAAGVSDQAFLAFAQMRCRHLRMPESQALHWLEIYRQHKAASMASASGKTTGLHP